MQAQKGFTLIELIVVIVILGILAAVALPRFVDLSSDATNAAAAGVAGAIASGTAIHYAAVKAGHSGAVALNNAEVCTDTILQPFVTGVTLVATPANNNQFHIGGTGNCSASGMDGATVTCTVIGQGAGATAQNATVTCSQ